MYRRRSNPQQYLILGAALWVTCAVIAWLGYSQISFDQAQMAVYGASGLNGVMALAFTAFGFVRLNHRRHHRYLRY